MATYIYPTIEYKILEHYWRAFKDFFLPFGVSGQTYVNISDRNIVVRIDVDNNGNVNLTYIPLDEGVKIAFGPAEPLAQPIGTMPEGFWPVVTSPLTPMSTPYIPVSESIPDNYVLPHPVITGNSPATIGSIKAGSVVSSGGVSFQVPPFAPGIAAPTSSQFVVTCVTSYSSHVSFDENGNQFISETPWTPCAPTWKCAPTFPPNARGRFPWVAYNQELWFVIYDWRVTTWWSPPNTDPYSPYYLKGVYSQTYEYHRQVNSLTPSNLTNEDTYRTVFMEEIPWPDTAFRPHGETRIQYSIHVCPVYEYNFGDDWPVPQILFPPYLPMAGVILGGGMGLPGGLPGIMSFQIQTGNMMANLLLNLHGAGRREEKKRERY